VLANCQLSVSPSRNRKCSQLYRTGVLFFQASFIFCFRFQEVLNGFPKKGNAIRRYFLISKRCFRMVCIVHHCLENTGFFQPQDK